jgi:fatty-acyl-CoA synthase
LLRRTRFNSGQIVTALAANRDQSASRAWLRALEMTARIEDAPARILPVVVDALGARFADAPAMIGVQETLSHAGLAARMNRYARWAISQGLAKGDCVALLMGNRPDYLAAWLGLTRIGAVVALINTNLRGDGLAHAIGAAKPKFVIVAPQLCGALAEL